MQRLFGRRATKPECDDSATLADIQQSKELIEKREAHLQRKLLKEVHDAVEHKKAGRKDAALGCLKRKKMIDQELASLVEQSLKLDTQEHTLASLKFSAVTLETERRATAAIRARVTAMGGPDALDEHRAKTEETLEEAYEMLGIAAQPCANPALGNLDDDDLLAELEAMEHAVDAANEDKLSAELTHVDMGGMSSAHTEYLVLPRAPATLPARTPQQEQEERELAELDRLAESMNLMVEKPMPMLGAAPRLVCAM